MEHPRKDNYNLVNRISDTTKEEFMEMVGVFGYGVQIQNGRKEEGRKRGFLFIIFLIYLLNKLIFTDGQLGFYF